MRRTSIIILFIVLSFLQVSAAKSAQLMTVNFDQTPIQSALRWMAKFEKQNLLISASVKGAVSLHLENVSWEEAFSALLDSQGLLQLKEGNIIYIAPAEEISQRERQIQIRRTGRHFITKIIRLNYAKASNIAVLLKNKEQTMLSRGGQVTVDVRTNALLIKDQPQQIETIKALLRKLDIPVPQVAIETRIVNIDDDYEKELGVKFGITGGRHLSGSLKGANEIAGRKAMADVNPNERLNVDLPSTLKNPGRIGLALFKLTQGTLIDLELSALESEGRAEIISTPRLMTANQQTAIIESGEEIPYQELASVQGATKTSFKKAVLRLKVTPQITPHKKIILYLEVNQDKRSNQEIQGIPAIDTRRIMTQVLVNNGQTVVLGGIYEQTRINDIERVPFFSDLPGVGVLFRHKKQVNNRRELLIFVTPNIINNYE